MRPALAPRYVLAVVKKRGAEVSAEEIAQWCRERLAAMKVPRYVLFVDELPHTPTHKVAKAVLRQDQSLRGRAVDLSPSPSVPLRAGAG